MLTLVAFETSVMRLKMKSCCEESEGDLLDRMVSSLRFSSCT